MRRAAHPQARPVQVRLQNIWLRREGRSILRGINWTIRPGQRWVLAGGNGAGKTQLLKLIGGAVWPTQTHRSATARAPERRYRWHGETFATPYGVQQEIAYVGAERQDKYERYGWNHSVEQIVGTGLYRTDIPLDRLTAADRQRIGRLLRGLGIQPLVRRRFLSLSYGERRLTLLARALASGPGLLLLDELLNGLDELNHRRALRWLSRTQRSRMPWVLATHRLQDVPPGATHLLVLKQGRILYQGAARGVALQRWLEPPISATPPRQRLRTPPAGAASATSGDQVPGAVVLLRLLRASVYLEERRILRELSFELRAGECWVVHGRNGSGKTTLIRTLYGDHGVGAGGRIEREGIEPGVPLEEFRRRTGLIAPHLQAEHPSHLSVSEVVQTGPRASIGLNHEPTRAEISAARRALGLFGLNSLAHRSLRELSYGQLRRVLFARAWACAPRLLLLDEPLAGIDAPTRTVLMGHMAQLFAAGTAILIATHHRSEWPPYATHELELAGGRARYCGPVRSSPSTTNSGD